MADDTGWVWRVSLQATLVGPIKWEQTQLFDEEHANRSSQLAQLIDTLSSRLGRSQVLEARLQRDAEPERSVSYRPLTGRRRDGVEQKTVRKLNSRLAAPGVEPQPTDPLRRPTRLLDPPQLLTMVHITPEGHPVELMVEDQRLRVLAQWGPERLESGWWRGPSVRREYFRIETDGGQWWWVFRDVQNNQWYLHGLF
jgi:protein ImuB